MEREELFRKYLERDLSPDDEREALHMIAEDQEMRSLLRFEMSVYPYFRDPESEKTFDVPREFGSRVMQRIQSDREKASGTDTDWLSALYRLIQKIVAPQTVRLRPVYGIMAVLLIVASVSLPFYLEMDPLQTREEASVSPIEVASEVENQVWLRFVYIDESAESVAVAGDFSSWEPIELTSQNINGEQVWTGLIQMSRGEHHYMFVKNGEQWITDPLAALQRDDGFGNRNAVIYL